jgi:hypothetical protein
MHTFRARRTDRFALWEAIEAFNERCGLQQEMLWKPGSRDHGSDQDHSGRVRAFFHTSAPRWYPIA